MDALCHCFAHLAHRVTIQESTPAADMLGSAPAAKTAGPYVSFHGDAQSTAAAAARVMRTTGGERSTCAAMRVAADK